MNQLNTGIKRYIIPLLSIVATVVIDQITKYLAEIYLKTSRQR